MLLIIQHEQQFVPSLVEQKSITFVCWWWIGDKCKQIVSLVGEMCPEDKWCVIMVNVRACDSGKTSMSDELCEPSNAANYLRRVSIPTPSLEPFKRAFMMTIFMAPRAFLHNIFLVKFFVPNQIDVGGIFPVHLKNFKIFWSPLSKKSPRIWQRNNNMSYDIAIWLPLESASSFVFGNLFSIHRKSFFFLFISLAEKFSKTCF